ncbi:MAG: AAA family ATPase [Caulobacter sp.]
MKGPGWKTMAGGLVCVGVAVAGQAIAGAVGGPAGAAVGGLALKALGEFMGDKAGDLVFDHGKEAIAGWLRSAGDRDGRLPINHDLARAVRLSQLDALDFIVIEHLRNGGAERLGRRIRDWTDSCRRLAEADDFLELEGDQAAVDALATALAELSGQANDPAALNAAIEDAMLAEFRAAGAARGWVMFDPAAFEARFRSGAGRAGWLGAVEAFFAGRLKQKDATALRAAFQLEQFRGLNQSLEALGAAMSAQQSTISDRLSAIEAGIAELADRTHPGADFSRAAARGLTADDIVAELRRSQLLGSVWSRTATAVQTRLSRLVRTPLYGRDETLARLDQFIAERDRGLLLVTGAAGSGKSSLMAHWLTGASQPRVARHLISGDLPISTDTAGIEGHLAAQLRALLDPAIDRPPESQPAGEQIHEMLAGFSQARSPGAAPLVILLDGLDEAARRIEPFIDAGLPEGVFILVSCRAESAAERPAALRPWLSLLDQTPSLGERLHVEGLDIAGIAEWIGAIGGDLSPAERDRLARGLHDRMDGLPLFISEVLQDLSAAAAAGEDLSLPAGFSAFVRDKLAELEDSGEAWSLVNRRLFALLCQTLGPIRQWEIEAIFEGMRSARSPELTSLDPRVSRWFVVSGEGADRQFAFHHPRLAAAFSEHLRPECAVTGEALSAWLAEAWRPTPQWPGAPYALDWGPAQLAAIGEPGQARAAALLADPAFLAASLQDHASAPRRLARCMEDWSRLPDGLRADERARALDAFWADFGDRLLRAWRPTPPRSRSYANVVMACLADADLGVPGEGRATRSARPPRSDLIRSISHPDVRHLEVGHGLVATACRRGWVRFWTIEGRPAGDPDAGPAHHGEIWELERLESGFASAGEDGRVVLWNAQGARLSPEGVAPAHRIGPTGITPLPGGGAVSFDVEGRVIFWNPAGAIVSIEDHTRPVRSVVAAHGLVLFTCDDGACHLRGEGGSVVASYPGVHPEGVTQALATPTGFVSWSRASAGPAFWAADGSLAKSPEQWSADVNLDQVARDEQSIVGRLSDGTVRFWSLQGEPRPGSGLTARAETQPEDGITAIEVGHGRALGLTKTGQARLWTENGELIARQDLPMTTLDWRIWAVAGGWLVTDGWRESMFLDLDGRPRTSVPLEGPQINVCLARPRLTITGNIEGRIRFWGEDGSALSSEGAAELHASHAYGVHNLRESSGVLISLGGDGRAAFWRPTRRDGLFDLVEPDPLAGAGANGAARADGAASWDHYGRLVFWNDQGEILGQHSLGADTTVDEALWSGQTLVARTRPGPVEAFDAGGQRLLSLSGDGYDDGGHLESGEANLVVSVSRGGEIVVWRDGAVTDRRDLGHSGKRIHWESGRIEDGLALWREDMLVLVDGAGRVAVIEQESWADDPIVEAGVGAGRVFVATQSGALSAWSAKGQLDAAGPPRQRGPEVRGLCARGDRLLVWTGKGRFDIRNAANLSAPPIARRVAMTDIAEVAALDAGFAVFGVRGSVMFVGRDGEVSPHPHGWLRDRPAAVCVAQDRICAADESGVVMIWDHQGAVISRHEGQSPIWRVRAFGDCFAAVTSVGDVALFARRDGQQIGEPGARPAHGQDADIDVLPDGRLLSHAPDDVIHIWAKDGALDDSIVLPGSTRSVEPGGEGLFVFGSRLWRLPGVLRAAQQPQAEAEPDW